MESDDPDLEAFESNLCQIIWARELGKTQHKCPIFAKHMRPSFGLLIEKRH